MNRQGNPKGQKFPNALSFTFPKISLRKIEFCFGVQLCLLSMMRWSAYQSWSPIGQESDKIIGNHFDIWHSQLTEYIHINLCGFWYDGVHESLQLRMWSNSTQQNLSVNLSRTDPAHFQYKEQHWPRQAKTCQCCVVLMFLSSTDPLPDMGDQHISSTRSNIGQDRLTFKLDHILTALTHFPHAAQTTRNLNINLRVYIGS